MISVMPSQCIMSINSVCFVSHYFVFSTIDYDITRSASAWCLFGCVSLVLLQLQVYIAAYVL